MLFTNATIGGILFPVDSNLYIKGEQLAYVSRGGLKLEKALKEMTNGYYPTKEGSVIIDVETGNVYDVNITVKESKMINGSEIILI